MEIERKYTVKRCPDHLEQYPLKNIEQGYLCKGPVVRIRKSDEEFILTYKNKMHDQGKEAIVNDEVELGLTEKAYLHLKKKIDHNMIYKKRYVIPIEDGLQAELDIFEGKLEGLCFLEVEFPDIASAEGFIAPDWFGEDVSKDKRYGNSYLSKMNSYEEFLESKE